MNKSLIINEMADIEIYFLEKYDISLYENLIGLGLAARGANATFGGRGGSYSSSIEETPKKTREEARKEKAAEKRANAVRKILQREDYAKRREQIRENNWKKRREKFQNSVEYQVGMQYR